MQDNTWNKQTVSITQDKARKQRAFAKVNGKKSIMQKKQY